MPTHIPLGATPKAFRTVVVILYIYYMVFLLKGFTYKEAFTILVL
jgi:hypothetical protein